MNNDRQGLGFKMIKSYLGELHEQDILEVGCGEGRIAASLAFSARSYTAIDPDPARLNQAISSFPEVDFRIGDGEALEFAESSFSTILFTLSLHHQDSSAALKEAHRVLTNKGKLVIIEPAADGEFQQFFNLFDDETEKLYKAISEIKKSSFALRKQDVFSTIIEFENQDELCNYPFDRKAKDPTDDLLIMDKLRQLKGALHINEPICLYNKLHIYLLHKY